MDLLIINDTILPQAENDSQPAISQSARGTGDAVTAGKLVTQITLGPGRAVNASGAESGILLCGITERLTASKTKLDLAPLIALHGDRTGTGQGLHSTGVFEVIAAVPNFAQQPRRRHIAGAGKTAEDKGVRVLVEQATQFFLVYLDFLLAYVYM